jgi:adenylate cyclase, class 2
MPHINIEIKASSKNPERIKSILKSRNANFRGVDHQIDTYFNVPFGRLKLREGNIENFLIYYDRENKRGPKQSNVILFKSDPKSSLKSILTKSLGILIIVDKKREIYFIHNVKFHIDSVKDLGDYVEIEAIDEKGNLGRERLLEQCESYKKLFGISYKDLISSSYSDLLLSKNEL